MHFEGYHERIKTTVFNLNGGNYNGMKEKLSRVELEHRLSVRLVEEQCVDIHTQRRSRFDCKC